MSISKFMSTDLRSILVGMGIGVVVGLTLIPDTIMLNRKQKMFQFLGEDGKSEQLSEEMNSVIKEVLNDVNLNPEEEKNLTFFKSLSSDSCHFGSLKIRTGAIIGVPSSFDFCDEKQLLNKSLFFQGSEILVTPEALENSENIQQLVSSIVLSREAKKFAIAREIKYSTSHCIHNNIIFKSLAGFGAIIGYYAFDKKLRIGPVSFLTQTLVLSFLFLLGGGGYTALNDAYNCYLDRSVDKETASLDTNYLKGGKEYYEKILKKNQILRKVTKFGHKDFTQFGNSRSFIRTKHLQWTTRKQNLDKMINDQNNLKDFQ